MKRLFKRRWLLLVLIPLVFLASVFVWLLAVPDSGLITKANFDRIQVGMSIKEVDEILGEEAANPITRLWDDGHRSQAAAIYERPGQGSLPRSSIWVEFAEDRVVRKEFNPPNGWEIYDRTLAPVLVAIGLKSAPLPVPKVYAPR